MLSRVQDGFNGLLRLRRNQKSEIAVIYFFEELPLPLVRYMSLFLPALSNELIIFRLWKWGLKSFLVTQAMAYTLITW